MLGFGGTVKYDRHYSILISLKFRGNDSKESSPLWASGLWSLQQPSSWHPQLVSQQLLPFSEAPVRSLKSCGSSKGGDIGNLQSEPSAGQRSFQMRNMRWLSPMSPSRAWRGCALDYDDSIAYYGKQENCTANIGLVEAQLVLWPIHWAVLVTATVTGATGVWLAYRGLTSFCEVSRAAKNDASLSARARADLLRFDLISSNSSSEIGAFLAFVSTLGGSIAAASSLGASSSTWDAAPEAWRVTQEVSRERLLTLSMNAWRLKGTDCTIRCTSWLLLQRLLDILSCCKPMLLAQDIKESYPKNDNVFFMKRLCRILNTKAFPGQSSQC